MRLCGHTAPRPTGLQLSPSRLPADCSVSPGLSPCSWPGHSKRERPAVQEHTCTGGQRTPCSCVGLFQDTGCVRTCTRVTRTLSLVGRHGPRGYLWKGELFLLISPIQDSSCWGVAWEPRAGPCVEAGGPRAASPWWKALEGHRPSPHSCASEGLGPSELRSPGPVPAYLRPPPRACAVCNYQHLQPQEDAPSRHVPAGRRRSWWKWDSGDSRTFFRMSRPESVQEATEVTLKTEVEAGASGYSVTGGGDQGIFVKQVLKDSSAAKLFSLREGDQLLSATVFFDNIKYEDALKILQYSEPYKVQFKIKRKLPACEDEDWAISGTQRGPKGKEKQDEAVADESKETPTKTLEGDGDRERLIDKPRVGRGRRSQRDRFSWPKFQAIKGKRLPGPRRSHSSSEAHDRGDRPDVSPTSTDTEGQHAAEHQQQEPGPGSQRRSRFLNLRFRTGSGPGDGSREETGAAWYSRRQEGEAQVQEAQSMQQSTDAMKGPSGHAGPAARLQRTKEEMAQGEALPQRKARTSQEREGQGVQSLEIGIARLSLQDSTDRGSSHICPTDIKVRIQDLKTPKFAFSKESVLEKETSIAAPEATQGQGMYSTEGPGPEVERAGRTESLAATEPTQAVPSHEGAGRPRRPGEQTTEERQENGTNKEGREEKIKGAKFKMPSFGWSPSKEPKAVRMTETREKAKEEDKIARMGTPRVREKTKEGEEKDTEYISVDNKTIKIIEQTQEKERIKEEIVLEEKQLAAKDSRFKMPKFKMPSFGVSAPGKSMEASLEVSAPKVEADVSLPSVQGDLKTSDLTIELPSADLEVQAGQVGVKVPEGQLPEGDLAAQASGAGLKGHLPKVQMPSFKMPKVDIKGPHVDVKGPKLDLKGPKGQVTAPELDVSVSVPGAELDVQAPGAKLEPVRLEGDLSLGDKDVAAKDSKFKMPKFKMPSFGVSAPGKSMEASLEVSAPKVEADVSLPSVQGDLKTSDLTIELPSADLEVQAGQVGVKVPEGQLPEGDLAAQASGAGLKGHLPKVRMPSFKMPKVDITGPQVDVKSSNVDRHFRPLVPDSVSECGPGLVHPVIPASHSHVSFPKFYKPKFVFSIPQSEGHEGDPLAADCAPVLSRLSPTLGPDSPQLPEGLLSSGPQLQGTGFPVPHGLEPSEPLRSSATATGRAPAEGADRDGKGSPFKVPKLELPSFSWSPKKSEPTAGPERSLEDSAHIPVSRPGQRDAMPGMQVYRVDVPAHVPPEKDGDQAKSMTPSLAAPELALPKMKASKGRGSLPPGDSDPSLSGSAAGGDFQPSGGAHSAHGAGTGSIASPAEELGAIPHLPRVRIPSLGFATPDLRSSKAKVEVSQAEADLRLPKGALSVGGGSTGLGDVSASQPYGVPTGPATEDPLQPSLRKAEADVPAVESPEEEAAAVETPVDSQERWFKMPTLRMPRFRRSSRDRGRVGKQKVAAAGAKELPGPSSEVEGSVSLGPPEAEADVTASESKLSAGVLGQDLDSTALMPEADPSSKARIQPAKGSLPLKTAGLGLSESRAPPEGGRILLPTPGECDPARVEEMTLPGKRSSQPEGPLKLKASSTDVPSQISVVNTNQLWEDSVLTVKFPKLKVPRFSFPAPSAEADVFIPTVREVRCPEGAGVDLGRESPGPWEASILTAGAGGPGEQPTDLDLSLAAPPISRVRVHIQGAQAESQEITIHSRVTPEFADFSAPRAFSTQIVRESEIPPSKIQTPAYGFSLLKVKIPEPRTQATAHTVTRDAWAREGSEEAPTQASPGADFVPGELQPDTGEPFEIISSSVSTPGPQTFTLEVHSGHQLADSCLDEEPAEILEFPPDDDQDATTPLADGDRAPKEKPESKKSGLLWSWLPNIGFSSSVDETSADSKEDVQRPAPVQTQPEARPDTELPKKQERAGWFRFPKLGFSSAPAKKGKSTEEEADLAEQKLHEETVTFFDARESFSPDEQDDTAGDDSAPRPQPREGHTV
nr:protein AHNAK2 isoform X1 [Microcebus murinus]